MELLLLEVLNPFYIFQVVSILIWIMIEYYYFCGAIFLMSATGIIISITQTRKVRTCNYIQMQTLLYFHAKMSFFICYYVF